MNTLFERLQVPWELLHCYETLIALAGTDCYLLLNTKYVVIGSSFPFITNFPLYSISYPALSRSSAVLSGH